MLNLFFAETDFVKLFRKHIEVHGRPTIPIFRSKPNTPFDRVNKQNHHISEIVKPKYFLQSYELSWSVDSYSPIEEYRLLYRKIKPYHGVSWSWKGNSLQSFSNIFYVQQDDWRIPQYLNSFVKIKLRQNVSYFTFYILWW